MFSMTSLCGARPASFPHGPFLSSGEDFHLIIIIITYYFIYLFLNFFKQSLQDIVGNAFT